jgi:hypothetical protein
VADCTCDVRPVQHHFAHGREMVGKYAVRLDQWRDETTFDPACRFHGDAGTMVVRHAVQGQEQPS